MFLRMLTPTIIPAVSSFATTPTTTSVWLLLHAAPCCTQRVVEYSSRLAVPQRTANLRAFTKQEAHVLICSDAMTRGMDVPNVANVVNYDAPVYVKTYVHRAGRTARAGRGGRVVTLLREEVWGWVGGGGCMGMDELVGGLVVGGMG